jgi:hypothetical protein
MRKRKKNYLGFALILSLAVFIYLWYYPLDKGNASVTVGLTGYWVLGSDFSADCLTDPCLVSLKSGLHDLQIRKDGYFPGSASIDVHRFKTTEVAVNLRKIPSLKLSVVVPALKEDFSTKPIPQNLSAADVVAPTWDEKGEKLAFLDRGSGQIKVWSDGTAQPITPLKNIGVGFTMVWAPDQVNLVGIDRQDLYLINTKAASRKMVKMEFVPTNLTWSPDSGFLLANDANAKVYRIGLDGLWSPMNLVLDLKNAVWGNAHSLFYYAQDEKENKTVVKAFDLSTQETTEILTKYDFPVSKITLDVNGAVYLYSESQNGWYSLEQ